MNATTERTLEAVYDQRAKSIRRLEADFTRELNAKLDQINAQAKTIRELVEALKAMPCHPRFCGRALDCIRCAALAKTRTYHIRQKIEGSKSK